MATRCVDRAATALEWRDTRARELADGPSDRRAAGADSRDIYRHTQFGWGIAAGTLLGLAGATAITLSLSAATIAAAGWMVVALYATLIAAFVLFAALTVEVDAAEIRIRFGIGIVRKSVPVADVLRCDLIRTRIWWGWGLHWTTSGWLYNVSGRDAVRLQMGSERPLIIGSDDAPALKAAIDERRAAAASARQAGRQDDGTREEE